MLFLLLLRILQCDKLQSSSDLDRVRIPDTVPAVTGTTYTEKNYRRMSLSFVVFFHLLPRLNCTVNIKTKNVQTKNILTKHPVSRIIFFVKVLFFLCVFSAIERTALNTNLIDGTEIGEKWTL